MTFSGLVRGAGRGIALLPNLKDLSRCTYLRDVIDVQKQLVRDFPSVPDYRARLGQAHINLGNELDDLGKSKEGAQEYDRALALYEPLVAEYPAIPEYRWGLANARAARACFLAGEGNYRQAASEASLIDDRAAASGMARYNLACAWSQILGAVQHDVKLSATERQKLAEEYAIRSLEWLEKSRKAGYFDGGANLHYLKTDKDLDALRSRPDFQKFLRELDKPAGGIK